MNPNTAITLIILAIVGANMWANWLRHRETMATITATPDLGHPTDDRPPTVDRRKAGIN
jgi:hypothetical protein